MADDDLSWTVMHRGEPVNYRIFSAQVHRARHPSSGREGDFTVIKARLGQCDRSHPGEEVVMVRQYRHGTESITLEIPGLRIPVKTS